MMEMIKIMKKLFLLMVAPLLSLCILLLGAFPHGVLAQTYYTITDLGTLGGSFSSAYGINDSGQVVGESELSTGISPRAFLWESGSGMQDLGTLRPAVERSNSIAFSINNFGLVVGQTTTVSSETHAFLWESGSGMQDLGTLGDSPSYAYDINDSGQVVGVSWIQNGFSDKHAFLWDSVNGMQDLGVLGGSGVPYSYAYGINNSGQVVGYSTVDDNPTVGRAFLWDSVNGMQDLGSISVSGGSHAYDINNSGQVVGYTHIDVSTGNHPFLWESGSGMQDLGTLNNSGWGVAYGINDAGQVVGYVTIDSGLDHAFLWDNENGIRDLNDLLPAGSGWTLNHANDINNLGQIVGYGTYNGETHAFALTVVPEPVSSILFLSGGAALVLRTYIKRKRQNV